MSRLSPAALDGVPARVRRPPADLPRTGGIVHLGVGAFHRAHQAAVLGDLREAGATTWSITGIGLRPADARVADGLAAQGGLYALDERDDDGDRTRVVDAVDRVLLGTRDMAAVHAVIADPATHVVSLTITEGGYLQDADGAFDPGRRDAAVAAGGSAFDVIVAGLALRRRRGLGPVTVMSCDNLVGNGRAARTSVLGTADLIAPDLVGWIRDAITFPDAMVDRITPATTDADRDRVAAVLGVRDDIPVTCEPFLQWVVEDTFAGPRPPWEEAGVVLVDDVAPYEAMKLQLLNAAHSALGYAGALLGHVEVAEAARDDVVAALLARFAEDEAVPAVEAATGLPAAAYAAEVRSRFRNRAIRDQVARLCMDGSAKLPVFLLPTVRAVLASGEVPRAGALVLACWARYLVGVADDGSAIDPAPDPLLAEARHRAAGLLAGDVDGFLGWPAVFGTDLIGGRPLREALVRACADLASGGVAGAVAALSDPLHR